MLLRWFSALVLLAASSAPSVRTIVHGIEVRYKQAKTLRATFFESYSESGGRRIAESGTVYFSHPGRMRWEYESPTTKLFLVDGTNAWFYIPADHTASRAKVKESSDWRTPVALLAGKADLNELCQQIQIVDGATAKSADEKPLSAGDYVLRCVPRGDSQNSDLQGVYLEVNPNYYLVRVVIHETGEVQTEFRFGNWEENMPIPEVKFHFQPPPGVSVVNQDELSGAIQ
ncbi:MAG TPA: outer membrane lipoprotein carrier protein LolA [Candidatus Acidoferrales bacterium]|nr:outer membrane lipoprotein carrier protein LolA [Candidatus Acidoferrales bacterium]